VARDFNGSTDRIDYANVLDLAGSAMTMSAWVYPETVNTTNDYLMALNASGDSIVAIAMSSDGTVDAGALTLVRFYITYREQHSRYGSGELSTGSWQHVLVTSDSGARAENMECYVDGATPGTSSNLQPGEIAEFGSAGKWSCGGVSYSDSFCFDGRIAEIGVWNRELTAGEIAALAKGFSPLHFLRGLQFYTKLIGRKDIDIIAGKTPTYDGSTVIEHPRIIYPG
jgi:hypothetical protein